MSDAFRMALKASRIYLVHVCPKSMSIVSTEVTSHFQTRKHSSLSSIDSSCSSSDNCSPSIANSIPMIVTVSVRFSTSKAFLWPLEMLSTAILY